MLTIYGVHRSRASRNIWLAHELGLPFRLKPVMQHYRLKKPVPDNLVHTRSPAFLAINPNGHIPSIDDEGLVLHESLAINLYLARKHGGPLAAQSVAEDGQMAMWALWAANELEMHALSIVLNGASKESVDALRAPFAVLNEAVASGYLVGGRFTVADINVAEVVRYAQGAKELFDANPKVKTWLETCQERPAFKKMWADREKEPA
ncbi:glutathione S-transferase family protein [soil metagenome]